jgi:hypothetical protein
MLSGKVGLAPGTTTLTIGPGAVNLVGTQATQDPGVRIRHQDGSFRGADLGRYFDARPTDFDLSKIYGYTPVHRGWLVGKAVPSSDLGACCDSCASGGPCDGLGCGDIRGMLGKAVMAGLIALPAATGAFYGARRSAGMAAAGAAGGAVAGILFNALLARVAMSV